MYPDCKTTLNPIMIPMFTIYMKLKENGSSQFEAENLEKNAYGSLEK